MVKEVVRVTATLERVVAGLDADSLDPELALDLVEAFSKIEKLGAAGKALAAERLASSGAWKTGADPSPAHLVARTTGDSVASAVSSIKTAARLRDLTQTAAAFRSGSLTQAQAAVISQAATAVPAKEHELLRLAGKEGIEGLREACLRVTSTIDPHERARRLYRSRSVKTWTDAEGAWRMDARLTPEAGAEVQSVLDSLRLPERAESPAAADADALVDMARIARGSSAKSGPKATVNVVVDLEALERGHALPGELCEVQGVGPIPVAAARSYLSDSFLKVVFKKKGEIEKVAHKGRTISAGLRTYLENTYPECAIHGCRQKKGLEIDHVLEMHKGGLTEARNLVRICSHHHRLKTYRGFRLERLNEKWVLVPPKKIAARAGPLRR